MNATLSPCTSELQKYSIADSRTDTLRASEMSSLMQDSYTTLPIPVYKPENVVLDEETLYASFEEAISERWQSHNALYTGNRRRQEARRHIQQGINPRMPARHTGTNRRSLLTSMAMARPCNQQLPLQVILFALMCILLGFDLMGLLILILH
jgi:hypothetical protein